jgi:hypothetical protein
MFGPAAAALQLLVGDVVVVAGADGAFEGFDDGAGLS